MSKKLPVIFTGHGSPVNAVQNNEFTSALRQISSVIGEKPRIILAISAHWQTEGTLIQSSASPSQIYDFYGFPRELYDLSYTPKGSPDDADEIAKILRPVNARCTGEWGIDHGTWSILTHAFPNADIPVIQLSLDYGKTPRQHYETGMMLSALRENGVLIIGSGNITHNLSMISNEQFDHEITDWAEDFDAFVKNAIDKRDHDRLIEYKESESACFAVATNEHYLPLLYTAGAACSERASYLYEGFQHSSISMRCLMFG